MIGIDSNRYDYKSMLNLDVSILSFTEHHADPEKYVILACENGIIKIFQPSTNNVIDTFDI
jgi:hypothetical protein